MFLNVAIGILLYFILAVALAAWWFVPGIRAAAEDTWRRGVPGGLNRRWRSARVAPVRHPARAARATWWVVGAVAALALVPAGVVWLRQGVPPELFDHTQLRPSNPRVAALLAGEQLVPPPALPPEFFLRADVQEVRPLIGSANREWALLDAAFRQRLLVLFQLMRERHGYELVLLEGYRSPERQAALKALGPTVTLAGAGESLHQRGLAADVAFVRDGRIVITERDPWAMQGYQLFGALAPDLGLTWGGQWSRLQDLGHLELRASETAGRR